MLMVTEQKQGTIVMISFRQVTHSPLPLPSGVGVLPSNAEASSGPSAQPHINRKVIETS